MAKEKESGLKHKLRSILSKEFDTISPDLIASVLSGLATELVQMSESGISQLSEVSNSEDWSSPQLDGILKLECRSEHEVVSLLHHILTVGAVVIPTLSPPDLNAVVEFDIHFEPSSFMMRTTGRVVHLPPGGVAIELTELSQENRLALSQMQRDLEQIKSKVDEAESVVEEGFENERPTESAPIPGVPIRTKQFRKNIDLTSPDVRILSALEYSEPSSKEFYGPAPTWLVPNSEPDRVEPLAEDRNLDILLQASQDGFSGVFQYKGEHEARQFIFDGGLIVEATRSPRQGSEELGWMLLQAERITENQLSMASAHADETKGTIARSLLNLDILNPEQIRNAIAGRLTFLLREFCKKDKGEIQIFGSKKLEAGFLPTPPLRVHVPVERTIYSLLNERFRGMSIKDRERTFDADLESYPEINLKERDRLEHALNGDRVANSFINEFITGRVRLKEVITASELSVAETFGIVKALHRMGILSFDQSFHQTIVRERYRENVTVKYLSVHKASYFEVLNVHWSSYTDVVQRAYFELVKQFDPVEVPEHLEAEVHQRVTEIRDRVESAFQILSDDETRRNYRVRIMPEYKLNHAIPLFMKQCELAKKRRKWGDAKDALLRVLEIDLEHRDAIFELDRIEAILDNRLSPDAKDSNF